MFPVALLSSRSEAQTFSSTSFTCITSLPKNSNDAASYAVKNLPNQTDALTASLNGQFSGYIPLSDDATNFADVFFWYFPSVKENATDLVVWLNGGPGCSSLFGSFVENGPIHMNENGSLTENLNSWHRDANFVYVEQPLGTGFSQRAKSSLAPTTEFQVASEFVSFLNGFYSTFPEARRLNLYLTGESYAGMYIPYIASAILTCKTLIDGTRIPLTGVAIGDGVLDQGEQFGIPNSVQANYDFLEASGFFKNQSSLQTEAFNQVTTCKNVRTQTQLDRAPFQCDVFSLVNTYYNTTHNGLCLDIYNIDFTVPCLNSEDEFYKEEDALTRYLNSPAVRAAIHVDPILSQNQPAFNWQVCSSISITQNGDYDANTSVSLLANLIANGIKVVIFNGDRDLLVNYVSTEKVLSALSWQGSTGFQKGPTNWTAGLDHAGLYWSERGLSCEVLAIHETHGY
ncbi:peptidase S10, serine carboxypeptidase [Chytriomyces sp. MP71]|nr:peptidase S10, serine carboxypeptidase [Chytriomyces sp. MP71]